MRVLILHPDLGIGGAERLVLDVALALKAHKHDIHIYTNHYDPNHSFEEAKHLSSQGKLTVVGDWLPRKIFDKYFYAFFAYLRFLFLACYIIFKQPKADLIICDQIPIAIPFLTTFNYLVIFYCHFPDVLLTQRKSVLKKVYRYPIDFSEEWSMCYANKIIVNSKFTASTLRKTFNKFKHKPYPIVLYPCISKKLENISVTPEDKEAVAEYFVIPKDYIFLSINRYETKKNVELVIYAYAELKHLLELLREVQLATLNNKNSTNQQFVIPEFNQLGLIIVGGYDPNLPENAKVYKELNEIAQSELGLQIGKHIVFLKSISDNQKLALLNACTALCYTPTGEHFGIVPLEAGIFGKPVVAVNDGGPRETVVSGQTGYLCQPGSAKCFALAMAKCLGLFTGPNCLYQYESKAFIDWFNTKEDNNDESKLLLDTTIYKAKPLFKESSIGSGDYEPFKKVNGSRSPSTITLDSFSSTTTSSPLVLEEAANDKPDDQNVIDTNTNEKESEDENGWDKLSQLEDVLRRSDSRSGRSNNINDTNLLRENEPIKAENCVAHVKNNFSFDAFADKLNNLVTELVQQKQHQT